MTRIGLLCLTVFALLAPAIAAENGCQKFAWSVANEQAWFSAPDKLIFVAGENIATIPKAAFTVKLQPAGEANLPCRLSGSQGWIDGLAVCSNYPRSTARASIRQPCPTKLGSILSKMADTRALLGVQDEAIAPEYAKAYALSSLHLPSFCNSVQ
jgi:hypothetical protein